MGSDYNPITLTVTAAREKKAVFSRRNSSGTAVDDSSRHIFSITLSLTNSGWAATNPSSPQWDFTSQRDVSGGSSVNQTPAYFGSNNLTGTMDRSENVPANLSQGAIRPGDTDHTFYLLSPGEMSDTGILGTPDTVAPTSGGTPVACLSGHLPNNGTAVVQLGSAGTLSGGTLTCLVKTRKWWHTLDSLRTLDPHYNYNPMTGTGYWEAGWVRYYWTYHESVSWTKYTYTVSKLICDDASIDTRRMYGQPQQDGALPGIDPNAPLRPVNFDNSVYRGGVYVGNIPSGTGDQSGLSRTQLYPRGGSVSSSSRWALLSMVHMGVPTGRGTVSSLAVTAYVPSSSDPNASVTNTQLHWDTRWDRSLATAGETLTFAAAADASDYSNWNWGGAPPSALTSVGILLANGTEDLSTFNWHYFASKEYSVSGATLPVSDAQPRLWVVDEGTVVRW